MIDDRAVERFGGTGKAPCSPAVAVARARVAARMIVGQHDSSAAVKRRVAHDLSYRKIGTRLIARMAGEMDAARLLVEMRDPQAFPLLRFIEAAGEEGLCGGEAVELQREFGTLVTHDDELRASREFAERNRVRRG